ncbi:MAG: EAL domain-containing protein [Gammaproteobacteria bacterium]
MVCNETLLELALRITQSTAHLASINISGKLIKDTDFINGLSDMAAQLDIQSSQLVLEVPAVDISPDDPQLQEAVMKLRMKRISVALEDITAGSHSAVRLKHFLISEIKIDHAFSKGAVDNRNARAVL